MNDFIALFVCALALVLCFELLRRRRYCVYRLPAYPIIKDISKGTPINHLHCCFKINGVYWKLAQLNWHPVKDEITGRKVLQMEYIFQQEEPTRDSVVFFDCFR